MHQPTIDAILSMLDTVEGEHRATYATTVDPYEQAQALAKATNTARGRWPFADVNGRHILPQHRRPA